jgi:hypothetical protein
MKFEFEDSGGFFKYEFHFVREHPKYVDIRIYTKGISGPKCWLHLIENGKIIWRHDEWMDLSQEAKDYVSHLVKLKAFM